jgi:hypothetical protein
MLRSGSSTAFRPVFVDRVVNRTITLVCVLIVYDGWANLRYRDVVGIILAVPSLRCSSRTSSRPASLNMSPLNDESRCRNG